MNSFASPPSPERQPVDDSSQVRVAVAYAARVARAAGFATAAVDTIVLAATELAENLHRHAVGGQLLVVPPSEHEPALALVAIDRGPGVDHFDHHLADGYTTIGTMGVGLGTVRRLAGRFDAVSERGHGTVVAAWFDRDVAGRLRAADAPGRGFDIAGVGFPVVPEIENGDSWRGVRRGARLVLAVADGLGHGPDAAVASLAVVDELAAVADREPVEMLDLLGRAARPTRGAAVTVATLEHAALTAGGTVHSAGLGNVALAVVAPDTTIRRAVTAHGTAGRSSTRVHEVETPFPVGATLVLHTDGLTSRWHLDGRTGLLRHSALVVAAVLWRDFARETDDSCVVVVRSEVAR